MNEQGKSGARGVQCFVDRCSCGAFHIHYRHAVVTVGKYALLRILEECYSRERKGPEINRYGYRQPFVIALGVVTLTIPWSEFPLFSRAVEEVVSEEIGLRELAASLALPKRGVP